MSKFNTPEPIVGTIIRIKNKLTVGEMIDPYYITTHMLIYAGKIFTIVDINKCSAESNYFYQINEGSFWWHKSWFDIIEE